MDIWYKKPEYNAEKAELVKSMVNYCKADQPIVETTYGKPFTELEAKVVLGHYLDYAFQNNDKWPGHRETAWLSDPYFRYIITKMAGFTPPYNNTYKGIRDRIWVYVASIKGLSKNPVFTKYYDPSNFNPAAGQDDTEPSEDPTDHEEEKSTTNKKLMIAGVIIAGIVGTKLMKLW